MASDLSDLYLNSRTCSMCFEDVHNLEPRRCSHVICDKCNAEFIRSNPDRDCQLCIGDFDLSCSDSDDESYLKPMKPPIAQRTSPVRTSPSMRKVCASCEKDEPVIAHCEQCKGYICRACREQHANMSALRNHWLSDIPKAPPIHCRKHPDMYVDVVCMTCKGVRVCQLCVQQAHRGHDIQDFGNGLSTVKHKVTQSESRQVKQETYKELIEQSQKLKLHVKERNENLSLSMEEAEKDIEANASSFVHNAVEEAEKTKREIDRQVLEYAQKISRQKDRLLLRLKRRQSYVQQRSQMINFELEKAEEEAQKLLLAFHRYSTDMDGYTKMDQYKALEVQRGKLKLQIDSLQKKYEELTFSYTPPTGSTSLGKIEALRKWNRIMNSCVGRIRNEADYVPSAMLSASDDSILFTSYKGATKAALDLVNINGNAIHSRKLQDNGQEPVLTPAFGAMIDNDFALMGWETTVFSLKMSTQDKVNAIGVKKFLVPSAKICCIACNHERKEVAIGNDKNRIINMFDFDVNFTSSVTIKEEGPPSYSLAYHGNLILFTDGMRTALAVDYNGNTVAQFLPPGYHSRPVSIDSSPGLVYILWKNSSSKDEEDITIVQCYSMLRQQTPGSPIGVPLKVPEETEFIAVITTPNGEARLVTGTADGGIAVYCVQEI